jgi:hypothetical protein
VVEREYYSAWCTWKLLSMCEQFSFNAPGGLARLPLSDFQILCVPRGRIHGRSLLKVREGNYKRGYGGTRWKLEAQREGLSLFQVL